MNFIRALLILLFVLAPDLATANSVGEKLEVKDQIELKINELNGQLAHFSVRLPTTEETGWAMAYAITFALKRTSDILGDWVSPTPVNAVEMSAYFMAKPYVFDKLPSASKQFYMDSDPELKVFWTQYSKSHNSKSHKGR